MNKTIEPGSWDFGEAPTSLLKMSSRGLMGADYSLFVKRAGEELAHMVRQLAIKEGQVPMHLIAMGATESYSANRNGDGFKRAMLMRDHPTFVSNAHYFRNHVNKDPAKSYGVVKLSHYNRAMDRVELLVLLHGNEKIAQEHGGLVADKELDKLASGNDVPVSMAISVPFDKCSSCGNQAKSRAEYCTEGSCIGPFGEKRGGCKHNLSKVASDGHLIHVDNPSGTFFDISGVVKPADMIAYGHSTDYLQKSAAGPLDNLTGSLWLPMSSFSRL